MNPVDKNSMQRMPVALSNENIEDVTEYTVFPSLESHFFNYLFDSFIARVLGLLSIAVLIYALFFVKTSELPSDGDFVLNYAQDQHPEKLHLLLHHAAAIARKEGALSSVSITPPAYIVDDGIEVQKSCESFFALNEVLIQVVL